jgi:hypothetical protein
MYYIYYGITCIIDPIFTRFTLQKPLRLKAVRSSG